eukprot:CAMPEP_0182909540 /NCGR_PEP_ID=MMETSP0034_2-20130328/35812_1 /TAXON_ID=156128 /ORGANISM="Nephroselmis pyriformis, Strain CCMP717" /LENGTH=89 /DNA_ID=CAMNT_0025045797 /DNA_START=201 /DNA_END=467 /DNA_ORIENTATION=+
MDNGGVGVPSARVPPPRRPRDPSPSGRGPRDPSPSGRRGYDHDDDTHSVSSGRERGRPAYSKDRAMSARPAYGASANGANGDKDSNPEG